MQVTSENPLCFDIKNDDELNNINTPQYLPNVNDDFKQEKTPVLNLEKLLKIQDKYRRGNLFN